MSTQHVWKPIRIQDQSKPKLNTWKLSKLKAYWAVTIKNSTNVFKLGDYMKLFSPDSTQPNPRKFQKYDQNPTQPNPTHG